MNRQRSRNVGTNLNGRRILVVEDRYLIARDICRAVHQLGGETIGPVRDLASAQRSIDRIAVDLVLVDLNLRNETATPLVRQLASREIPFILATGYEDWVLPPDLRGSPRVEKPVSAQELRLAIERLQQ